MKLIEVLVRFIKREDIPDDCFQFTQDSDGAVNFHNHLVPILDDREHTWRCDNSWIDYVTGLKIADDWKTAIVTMPQYEAALAASKEMLVNKPAWDGQGLPPVGAECEIKRVADWMPVTIKFISERHTIFTTLGGTEDCYQTCSLQFRPIRTEADKKRSDICDKIYGAMTNAERKENRSDMAEDIYDAIAAGNIPGVKLEVPDED